MRLKLISCDVFRLEVESAMADSSCEIELEYLPMGLHELPVRDMCARIQEVIDRVSADPVDAIVLAFGICSGGLVGLRARAVPLVLPRAHDCISILLGSRKRHEDYLREHPGACFRSSGWLDRPENSSDIEQSSIRHRLGLDLEYRELVEKYGEDNARYIAEQLSGTKYGSCDRLLFIEMGVEPDDHYEKDARAEAEAAEMQFDRTTGDLSLLQRLLDAEWDEREFLVIEPGRSIVATWGQGLIESGD